MQKLFNGAVWTFGIAFIVAVVLGFMAITHTGFAIVNDGDRGIMKTGTKYDMQAVQPGYHFFMPIYQTMDIKTIRPILVNYSKTEGNKEDTELLNYEAPLKGLDKKGIPVSLALSIEIKPNGSKLPLMYREDGDFENSFYKKVLQVNREAVQSTISKFSVDTIMDHRAEVERVLTAKINESYATNPYFTLVGINLKDILVPEKITAKMLDVQVAKQDALRSNELIKKAENEAKAEAAKALGMANKKRIEAQGKADAILLEATATAKANKLVQKSLTKELIDYKTKMRWNGVLPTVTGSNGMIIDIGKVTK
jgi:regulator of protease activity HflC (stomatin/prohibitin superfamily)